MWPVVRRMAHASGKPGLVRWISSSRIRAGGLGLKDAGGRTEKEISDYVKKEMKKVTLLCNYWGHLRGAVFKKKIYTISASYELITLFVLKMKSILSLKYT